MPVLVEEVTYINRKVVVWQLTKLEEIPAITVWVFGKLLKQRGESQWVERELSRAANLITQFFPNLSDKHRYKKEIEEYNQKFIEKQLEDKLIAQKRRHDYRYNLKSGDWALAIGHFDFRCAYCGEKKDLTVDHFVPFSKGGQLTKGNIVPACRSCNSSKNNYSFGDWYPKQPFYDTDKEKYILDFIKE